MDKFAEAKFDGKNIYIHGNARKAPLYYNLLLKNFTRGKRLLDIGCGDGIIGKIVDKDVEYEGVDIGAGCYEEIENSSVKYIREYTDLTSYVKDSLTDVALLIDVLEHTPDFSDLFVTSLKITKDIVFVSLPNEENIHVRLNFLFGKGIASHGLEMHEKHLNHRHLWLIEIFKSENILTSLARQHGFTLHSKHYTVVFPSKKWKRLIYRVGIFFLPWNLKARSVAYIFKKI